MQQTLEITQVRNAKSLQADNTAMDVEINHPDYGWIPYTIRTDDTDTTIDNSEVLMLIGTDFEAYVPPTQEELDALAAQEVRNERDGILFKVVDPIVSNPLRWAEMTPETQAAWAQYRQDLLDVPQQTGFPHSVTWPTEPS